jgi:YfiH family protein
MFDTRLLPHVDAAFRWIATPAGPALVSTAVEAVAPHLVTTRTWTLGSRQSSDASDGWSEVEDALGVRVVHARQIHGTSVLVCRAGSSSQAGEADIIINMDPAVAVAVQSADCVPLLLADRRTGAIAAVHAGWRGLAVRVPAMAVAALRREFGSRPADLIAAAGPSIGACCYEVGADVRERFLRAGATGGAMERWFHTHPQPTTHNPSMPQLGAPRPHHWYFDSWSATHDQLQGAGVPVDQIHIARLCTASHPDTFCSYRRDGTGAGRMVAAIRMR